MRAARVPAFSVGERSVLSRAPFDALLRAWRRAVAALLAIVLCVGSAACPAVAFELFGRKFFESDDETAEVPDPQAYTLAFNVVGADRALTKALQGASTLSREEKKPPPGTAGLIARARGDYGRILAALYANGYYGGSIDIAIEGVAAEVMRPDAVLPDPASVTVSVDPGPLFHFGEITVLGLPGGALTEEDSEALDLKNWDLVQGQTARSAAVVAAESRLVALWRQRGHPKAAISRREVIADHRTLAVDVTLAVEPGPAARFDASLVTGTERIDPAYARFMTGIKGGEAYDPHLVERARRRLQDLGVFASVSIEEGEAVGPDGLLPITFVLRERKRRLIGAGASYATTDGAALEAYWMHRNLFGHAESLRFDASVSRIGAEDIDNFSYAFATTFKRPGVFTPDTDATFKLSAVRETVDTYESTTFAAVAGLDHRFSERLTGSAGVNAEWADIDDAFGSHRYVLISLPSKLDYDSRDNKLDPTEGLHATLEAEPFTDLNAGTLAVVNKGSLAGYYGVGEEDRLVLAARGALGSIVGGDIQDVPATRRFFLGGGGSIRGYEYRSVGPSIGGEVVGGLSFFETSLELRLRVTDTIGIVPFIDAGAAYEDSLPDFSEPVRVGAGIGIRYHTPLGPLRFDVAVPINDKDAPAFAFYVGLGQAF